MDVKLDVEKDNKGYFFKTVTHKCYVLFVYWQVAKKIPKVKIHYTDLQAIHL